MDAQGRKNFASFVLLSRASTAGMLKFIHHRQSGFLEATGNVPDVRKSLIWRSMIEADKNLKIDRVIVTRDELRNGWDDASLRKYLEERNEAQVKLIDPRSEARRRKPAEQNHRYRPHRWRE